MDSNQIDRYNMLLKVDDFFDDHAAATAAHDQIDPKHDELEQVITDIQTAAAEAIADHTGVTEDKSAVRTALEQQTFTALTALSSYARDTKNRKLLNRVHRPLSELQKMRDAVLHLHASVVANMLTTHIAALAAYAYTPAQQAALTDTLADFLDITTEPKDAIEERAVANEQVALLLNKATGILEDLDGYMETFRFSNTALYAEYQLARAIDDAGGGTGGGGSEEDYSAEGSLAAMQMLTVLEFTYDGDLTYQLSHTGPAPQMVATLLQDGMPVPGATPIVVNMGTPMTGKLHTWAATGNQLQLQNPSAAMSLTYAVSLITE